MTSPVPSAEKNSPLTVMQTENTAAMSVMWLTALEVMNVNETIFTAEMQYLIALSLARNLLEKGLLTEEEYAVIDTILTERFKPSLGKLLSENPLI